MAVPILVIRLGALGDFIQSSGPFAAIRAHHPDSRIVLLTTKPFAEFAKASPWFDEVWIDSRPRLWNIPALLELRQRLRQPGFGRVYDLQTSDRSSWYFRLMGGTVPWSGIAKGCSLPDSNPERCHIHTLDRQAIQLALAGIPNVPPADLSWAGADLSEFGLGAPYVLICPGGAPHRPAKRWPSDHFAQLAKRASRQGLLPVLLGTAAEADELSRIAAEVPGCVNLGGRTSLFHIAALARTAIAAIGNDTGPMHLIAASGCRCLVLFSHDSDPARCAPRGARPDQVSLLRRPDLRDLPVADVASALDALLAVPS